MTLIALAASGNALSINNDARKSSMASCMMTRIRGLWADRVSLLEPGTRYKSVSLEAGAGVGAGGVETPATAGVTVTGVEDPDELNKKVPVEPNKPEKAPGVAVEVAAEAPRVAVEVAAGAPGVAVEVAAEARGVRAEAPGVAAEAAAEALGVRAEAPGVAAEAAVEAPGVAAEAAAEAPGVRAEAPGADRAELNEPDKPSAPDEWDMFNALADPFQDGRYTCCYKYEAMESRHEKSAPHFLLLGAALTADSE
jgi:hypothetical protein